MAVIAEVNRDPKRRSQPYKASDFLPKEEMTDDQIYEHLKAVFGDKTVKRTKQKK